jgi:hypothetical protein
MSFGVRKRIFIRVEGVLVMSEGRVVSRAAEALASSAMD